MPMPSYLSRFWLFCCLLLFLYLQSSLLFFYIYSLFSSLLHIPMAFVVPLPSSLPLIFFSTLSRALLLLTSFTFRRLLFLEHSFSIVKFQYFTKAHIKHNIEIETDNALFKLESRVDLSFFILSCFFSSHLQWHRQLTHAHWDLIGWKRIGSNISTEKYNIFARARIFFSACISWNFSCFMPRFFITLLLLLLTYSQSNTNRETKSSKSIEKLLQ